VDTLGIGSFIKVIFKRAPPKTNKNPCGQVGLSLIKIWGQPLGYYKGVVNEATPLYSKGDLVDRVLIEMGLPISDNLVNWNHADVDAKSYTYAPVDEETRQTLIDMERLRNRAYKS
jgi:centrosomal protein CEP104